VQKLIAEWNTDLKLWGNWETDLLSERWEPFLETWPTSGTMRNGQVFELQMPTHPTSVLESSSPRTLPTPRAQNGEDRNNKIWARDPSKPQNLENALAVTLPTPRASEPGSTSVGYGDSLNDFASRITLGYAKKDLQLLRSPKASEGQGGALGEAEARRRGNTVGVRDQVMDLVASQGVKVSRNEVNALLPTPNTMEHREIKTPEQIAELKAKSPGGYRNLRETVINELPLLPTPIVRDYKDGQAEVIRDGKVQTDTVGRAIMNSGEVLLGTPRANAANPSSKQIAAGAPKARLEDQVHIEWGKFGPAIQLWEEYLGREAPAPTKPDGKENNHRLSSKFTEWMMGLPEGWITDVGLKRNEELKLAGNGVVPQQAELALKILLENTPPPARSELD
jgi:hypothetical protein